MKKILKYFSLFIITLTLSFGWMNNTNAACKDGEKGCIDTANRTIYYSEGGSGKYRNLNSGTTTSKYMRTFSFSITKDQSAFYAGYNYFKSIDIQLMRPDQQNPGKEKDVGGTTVWNAYKDNYSALFCMDANLPGTGTLYAYRIVNDPSYSLHIKVFDYALTTALLDLKDETTQKSDNSPEMSVNYYFSKMLAIRALVATFKNDRASENSNFSLSEDAIYGTVYKWLQEDQSTYNELAKIPNIGLRPISEFAAKKDYYFIDKPGTNNGYRVNVAKEIYQRALSAALEYSKTAEENQVGSITDLPNKQVNDLEPVTDNVGTLVGKEVTHTLTLKGFDKNNPNHSLIINGLKATEGQSHPGLMDFYISSIEIGGKTIFTGNGNSDFNSTLAGKNLLQEFPDVDFSDETQMVIKVKISGYKSVNEGVTHEVLRCNDGPLDYYIDGSYQSDVTREFSDYVVTIWYANLQNEQRYLSIEPSAGSVTGVKGNPWKSSFSVTLINTCDCDALKRACEATNDWDSDECKALVEAGCDCEAIETQCDITQDEEVCGQVPEVCGRSCEVLKNACIKTDDWESDECKALVDADCDCEEAETQCEITGDEEACGKVPEVCDLSCEVLRDNCIATNDWSSTECQILEEADCDCEEADAKCELTGDQEACDTADSCYDHPDDEGVVCNSGWDKNFECCDAADELIVSTKDDKEINIKGLESEALTQSCFVSTIDGQCKRDKSCADIEGVKDQGTNGANGNTFGLLGANDNKYCAVQCKEDYLMTMPTAKLVNAGRYFTFRAKIDGTKTCYTNTIQKGNTLTEGTYVFDITQAQIAIVSAYNDYKYWEAALNSPNAKDQAFPVETSLAGTCGCENNIVYAGSTTGVFEYDYIDLVDVNKYKLKTGEPLYEIKPIKKTDNTPFSKQAETEISDTDSHQCPYYDHNTNSYNYQNETCNSYKITYEWNLEQLKEEIDQHKQDALEALYGAIKEYNSTIKQYQFCTKGWQTAINFDPKVSYTYEEEEYMSMIDNVNQNMKLFAEDSTPEEQWFCIGSINSNYDACSGQLAHSLEETIKERKYVTCNTENCAFDIRDDISDADYLKRTEQANAEYVPETLFYNVYPTGQIVTEEDERTTALETEDGRGGLPVSLKTPRGIYDYTVNVTNIGEFYDVQPDDNLGRFLGARTTNGTTLIGNTMPYACAYLVNIPYDPSVDKVYCDVLGCDGDNCMSNCVGPNCEETCDGTNCVANCVGIGCIYDDDSGSSLYERVVSLTNIFPNGTQSHNWNRDAGTLASTKAGVTIDEIEGKAETIYDETPVLSLTISPRVARAIKSYNASVENEGGYSNETLDCYSLAGYEESACFSRFITGLLNGEVDGSYYENIANSNSLIASQSYRNVGDVSGSSGEYFEMWSQYDPSQTNQDMNGAEYGTFEYSMVGPSWK